MWRLPAAPLGLVVASLLDCAAMVGGQGEVNVTAIGSPMRFADSETDRVEVWRKLHGGLWPPPKVYPGGPPRQETEGWVKAMEEREKSVRAISSIDLRWHAWLDLAQMRLVRNFTERGWAVVNLDPAIHADMASAFANRSLDAMVEEGMVEGLKRIHNTRRDLWYITEHVPDDLRTRLKYAVRDSISAWVGIPTEKLHWHISYGVRIYRNNSIIQPHVDKLRTNVLSAIYCVAIEGEELGQEPWYLNAQPDFTGETVRVDMRPGQLFLYESAKLMHGRLTPFRGLGYANIFLHFHPEGWELTEYDRLYVPPEGWSEPGRSPQAEL